ncbi:MAG TPA: glycosyltransferase family 4 protein [Vicinamibacteria bacterium]|nr:glycosyltransferase family 4 protein [Vicinamibacteria bacterium]
MTRERPARVHQLLAALSYGDAISNEALAIQRHLREAGFESDIFAEGVHPRMAHLARPLREYREVSAPDTVCLFHFSIGSAAGRLIHEAPDRLVVVYHNITPGEWFLGFHPHLAGLCYHGRRELSAFAARTELALGDSEYNRRELEAAGYARTGVLPIVLDLDAYRSAPSPVTRRLFGDDRVNVLFVGRVIPNKRIDDLVRTFALYQRGFEPRSRLVLAGDHRGHERYFDRLQELVRELRVEEVVFTGHVDHDDLLACYASADVFLCLSEHEGFCVPLQEAMLFEVPVIAYDAGAVAETLRGGGILLRDKPLAGTAALLDRVVRDGALRRAVLASQERAIATVRRTDFGALLRERLAPVLAGLPAAAAARH